MNKPTIEATLNEDGTIEMEGQNFQGPDCEKARALFDDVLGKKKVKHKPEYYQASGGIKLNQKIG